LDVTYEHPDWTGLNSIGLDWTESAKMDPCPTLWQTLYAI